MKNFIEKIFCYENKDCRTTLTILGFKIKYQSRLSLKEISDLKLKADYLENRIENLCYEMTSPCNLIVPKVADTETTVEKLIHSDCSMCRFGDGELNIVMQTNDTNFQKLSDSLSVRLAEVLSDNDEKIMVCLPNIFASLNELNSINRLYWTNYLAKNRLNVYKYIDMNKIYYNSLVSRPTASSMTKNEINDYFKRIKLIWENKDIVIVEGALTRFGIGNDLLENCRSIKRILCPARNSYEQYDEIFKQCMQMSKECLFLIALGPTATVLSYDLAKNGYRALDLGHLDIEYEWFLRDTNKKIKIPGKYVNEAKKGGDVSKCTDKNYNEQIHCLIK